MLCFTDHFHLQSLLAHDPAQELALPEKKIYLYEAFRHTIVKKLRLILVVGLHFGNLRFPEDP